MTQDETSRLFYEDVAEKKSVARGARHRASRTGKVGKVNLPADFLGRAYTKSSPAVSFSIDDVLYMLQETPTLKQLLMQRLDAEYEHYKLAIERTLDAVARIQENALASILGRLQSLEEKINSLPKHQAPAQESISTRRQARSLPDIREHVFPRLAELLTENATPDFKSVISVFPGIRYYVYQLKIWPGFQEMLSDFQEWKKQMDNEKSPTAAGENQYKEEVLQ